MTIKKLLQQATFLNYQHEIVTHKQNCNNVHIYAHTYKQTHSDYRARQMRKAYTQAHVVAINFKLRHISTDKNYIRASKLNNANAEKTNKAHTHMHKCKYQATCQD